MSFVFKTPAAVLLKIPKVFGRHSVDHFSSSAFSRSRHFSGSFIRALEINNFLINAIVAENVGHVVVAAAEQDRALPEN